MTLAFLFFLTAVLYSSVGFGGGSSYIALLFLFDTPYTLIPIIALVCNIIVVSGNSFHYIRAGYFNYRLAWPLCVASVPMAYIGGRIPIDETIFVGLLSVILLLSGVQLLRERIFTQNKSFELPAKKQSVAIFILTGGCLGFIAGLTGIGGGIFLAPALYFLKAERPKQIACVAAVFILVNSLAGIAGQLQKLGDEPYLGELQGYWQLPISVILGAQLGNLVMTRKLGEEFVATITAILVIVVSLRLMLEVTKIY